MQIKIEDKVYDINKIEDDQIKLDANVLIAKINQHRLNKFVSLAKEVERELLIN